MEHVYSCVLTVTIQALSVFSVRQNNRSHQYLIHTGSGAGAITGFTQFTVIALPPLVAMVLSSLRYEGQSRCEEARCGIVICDGSAHRFKEWRFQTEMEITAAKDDDNKKNNNGKAQSPSGKTAGLSYQAS